MKQQFENNPINILAPLQKAASFDEKIDAVIDYLKIGVVKCTVKESINKIPHEKDKYTVTGIQHSLGTPSYLKSYLNTSWKYLEESLEETIAKDEGYYNTKMFLFDCRQKCLMEMDKYEFDDPYLFEAIHSVLIVTKTRQIPVLWNNLIFTPEHLVEIRDQCLVRRSFLKSLLSFVDTKFFNLINVRESESALFEWDSDDRDLEITELLYALRLAGRIKLKGGITEPQFRQKFFNFFGLDDKDYNKRTGHIRARGKRAIFLNKLVTEIERRV